MKFTNISILTAALLLMGCGNSSNKHAKQESETPVSEKNEHPNKDQSIELNHGKKWKVDDNMMVHIQNMQNDILTYKDNEEKDYNMLSKKLQANVKHLTSNCTMKGKAHDELHKWLLPYIDLVDDFSEVENDADAQKQFGAIQQSFQTFNQYFE